MKKANMFIWGLICNCFLIMFCLNAAAAATVWSTTPPDALCITKPQYRSRLRTISYGSEAVAPDGWTNYYDEPGEWGEWISNGSVPISADIDREVRTIAHDAVTEVTGYSYKRYVYKNNADGLTYITYGSDYATSMGYSGKWETMTTSEPLAKYKTYDGVQAYGSSGAFWFFEVENKRIVTPAYTEYQYRIRERIYYYYKWTEWSEWQDGYVEPSINIEVETRILYAVDESRPASSIVMGSVSRLYVMPDTGCQLRCGITNEGITWKSSDPSVISVDSMGFISAHKTGAATVSSVDAAGNAEAILVIADELIGLSLPEQLSLIDESAFSNGTFNYLDLQNTMVRSVADSAFSENDDLLLVLAGDHLEFISDTAFSGCDNVMFACASDNYAADYARKHQIPYYVVSENIPYIQMLSIELDRTEYSLTTGKSGVIKADIVPNDATDSRLYWVTDNPAIATVSADGIVQAFSPGVAVITVTNADGSVRSSCVVTVEPIYVSSISLNKISFSLVSGNTATITASVLPAEAACKTISWSSSDASVAVVDDKGKVTGVSAGSAVITAQAIDGSGVKAVCTVTVRSGSSVDDSKFAGVYVNNITQTDATIGYSMPLSSNPTSCGFYLGTSASDLQLICTEKTTGLSYVIESVWYNMNKKYGELKPGTTYYYQFFMVHDGVICKSSVRSFTTLSNAFLTIQGSVAGTAIGYTVNIGEGETFQTTISYAPSTAKVTWSSSNSKVATVKDGVITAVSGGTATVTVTVTYGDKVMSAQYTVNVDPIEYHVFIVTNQYSNLYGYDDYEEGTLGYMLTEVILNAFGRDNVPSPACVNDGEALARAMRYRASILGITPDVHLYRNPEKETVINGIKKYFCDSDDNDINIFFYGGHGLTNPPGMVLATEEFITVADLTNAFKDIGGRNVVIFSCCYSEGLFEFADTLDRDRFYLFSSSRASELSWNSSKNDLKATEVTSFGYYFMQAIGWDSYSQKAISSMRADANGDNKVTLSELYNYIAPLVRNDVLFGENEEQNVCYSWPDGNLVIYQRVR